MSDTEKSDNEKSDNENTITVPPNEQCEIIKKLIEEMKIKDGDEAFLISTTWFTQWQKYVGYENTDEASKSQSCDEIDNSDLYSFGRFDNNKKNQIDYVIVSQDIWEKLHSWYGGGPELKFPIIYTGEKFIPNDSPMKLKIHYNQYKEDEKEYKEVKKTLITNNEVLGKQLKMEIYKLFGIHSNTVTKLSDFYNNAHLKYIEDSRTIQSNTIYDKQDVVVCRMHKDKSFRYDKESGNNYYYSYYDREAEGPGIVGLNNLGNTCYFNSGTQCLLHSPPLIDIFLYTNWKKDLNTTNPIGMKGELATAFASLMECVWGSHPKSCYAPRELKEVIGRKVHQFSGYDQQDSQELITFMLDYLHEDLNRCKVKPTVESVDGDGTNDEEIAKKSWDNFKLRNDSVIFNNFYGQFRSSLYCPNCHKTTVIFDSFNIISLPISMPKATTKEFIFIPADFTKEQKKITVSVPEEASFERISAEISKEIGRKVNVVVGSESSSYYSNSVKWGMKVEVTYANTYYYRSYSTPTPKRYFAFEVPDEYEGKFLVPCIIQMKIKSYYYQSKEETIAGPILVPVSSADASEDEIAQEASKVLKCIWEPCDKPISSKCQEIIAKQDKEEITDEDKDEMTDIYKQRIIGQDSDDSSDDNDEDKTIEKQDNKEISDKDKDEMTDVDKQRIIGQDGNDSNDDKDEDKAIEKQDNEEITDDSKKDQETNETRFEASIDTGYSYSSFKSLSADTNYPNLSTKITCLTIKPKFYSPKTGFNFNSLFRHFDDIKPDDDTADNDSNESVNLSQCFKYFSMPDVLDEDNQWFCPKCRQFVCANKKMDIWKVPNCLILHLKRFITNGYSTEKDERMVNFPEIINLKDYVVGPQKNDEDMIYRLYAVSEHSGFMGGGHYTAHAKVIKHGQKDGPWYYFNDSSASKSSFESTQNREAYVLFYQKYDPNQTLDDHSEEEKKEEEEKGDSDEYVSSDGEEVGDEYYIFQPPIIEKKKKSRYGFYNRSSDSDDNNPYNYYNNVVNGIRQQPYQNQISSSSSSSENDNDNKQVQGTTPDNEPSSSNNQAQNADSLSSDNQAQNADSSSSSDQVQNADSSSSQDNEQPSNQVYIQSSNNEPPDNEKNNSNNNEENE